MSLAFRVQRLQHANKKASSPDGGWTATGHSPLNMYVAAGLRHHFADALPAAEAGVDPLPESEATLWLDSVPVSQLLKSFQAELVAAAFGSATLFAMATAAEVCLWQPRQRVAAALSSVLITVPGDGYGFCSGPHLC